MRKALRATLILFPLLGITHLLFFINPKDGTHDKLYIIFNATMQSSQVNTQWVKINSEGAYVLFTKNFVPPTLLLAHSALGSFLLDAI